jgi:5,10-methylenetetrahydrofolate reductase
MLSAPDGWVEMVEVNPPRLPTLTHRRLEGRWRDVLITDNPFKQVRMSPYAFAARITHDVPAVRPTVVCSTRDRNILAIESEVRGALVNGVESFLVVQGDVLPEVEHWSDSYEIVAHLRSLQDAVAPVRFEVGMSTRSRRWMLDRRIEAGGQFFSTGPVLDPATVAPCAERLGLADEGRPPIYLEITPPFSSAWIHRLEGVGAIPVGDPLRRRLERLPDEERRREAWRIARETAEEARAVGFSGVVLMGLRFETLVGEAYDSWHDPNLAPAPPATADAPSTSDASARTVS